VTEQEMAAMTTEEWDAFTKALPCAVIDFRNIESSDDEDASQQECTSGN